MLDSYNALEVNHKAALEVLSTVIFLYYPIFYYFRKIKNFKYITPKIILIEIYKNYLQSANYTNYKILS